MKMQLIIVSLVLSMALIVGCEKQQIVGGDKDIHGCIGSAGYSWDADVGACTRNWEIKDDLARAAKIAVAPLSYPVTVTAVDIVRCEGCFNIHLQRNDNSYRFVAELYSWEIKKTYEENATECGECPQLSPPAPGFCTEGTIVAGEANQCGCQSPPTCVRACTEEAKICPDGSAVGRTGPNCEFAPCPNGTGIANPASKFCIAQGGESKIVTAADGSQSGVCILSYGIECDEWAYFRGECPPTHNCTVAEKAAEACTLEYMPTCGDDGVTYGNKCAACASKNIDSYTPGECPAKTYITRNPEQCKVIRYVCIKGRQAFTDDFGCGCEVIPTDGKLKANDCTEPRTQACTKEYVPVCGWFNLSIECDNPPCKNIYGNKCMACSDEKVAYWTEGTCPE